MTGCKAVLAGLCMLAVNSPALAQLSKEESAKFDKELARILSDPVALEREKRRLGLNTKAAASRVPARAPTVVATRQAPPESRSDIPLLQKNTPFVRGSSSADDNKSLFGAPAADPRAVDNSCLGLKLLVRQDWKNIGLLGCPETTDSINGAEASFAYDRVTSNQIWTVRGTTGVFFTSLLDTPGFYYQSFGAYLTVNRVFNSAPSQAKGDSDKMAFGFATEFGVQTDALGTHYLRMRGGAVEDRLKDQGSVNMTAEWIPVYDDGNIHIRSPWRPFNATAPFLLQFDPVLLVQYASVTGANQVLDFNNRTQALRIGPQLTLRIFGLPDPSSIWSRVHATINYHWAYEALSGRGISWFDTAVTYNVDANGQFGITGSYKKGRDEDTGTLTDIYKIALTGKI